MAASTPHVRSDFFLTAAPRLRERRKMLRLTQAEVAAAAEVSEKLVGMIESGKPTVQLDGLERVLAVLGFALSLDEN